MTHELMGISGSNKETRTRSSFRDALFPGGGGGLAYMGYKGMCGPKGYGFSAVLVINRVSILADFGHFRHN